MTNEELRSVAEIVERLVTRLHKQAADHEAKMVEHRAAFGARTEADAKIIAGLRSEIGAARMAVLERDSLISERAKLQAMVKEQSDSAKAAGELLGWTDNESPIQAVERVVRERDGLLTQVQDMRVEIERLRIEAAKCKAERDDLYQLEGIEQKRRMDVEDERDALLAEVDFLKTLRPKYKVGDKLMSHSQSLGPEVPVTVQGIRVVYDCSVDGAKYECVVGHAERELILVASHDTDAGKAAAESVAQHSAGIDIGTWSRKVTT